MTIPVIVSGAFQVQYSLNLGATWLNFGPPVDLGALKRTRRIGQGPRQGVSATHWRVVKVGTTDWDATVVSIDALRFWRETDELSPVKLWTFAFDKDAQRYVLVATDRNIEVYHQRQRVAAIAAPHTAAQLQTVTKSQVLDTMLQFHTGQAPFRITRQGAHDQWDGRAADFVNVPIYDFTGARAGGVNEVQQLRFVDYVDDETFNITLEGEITASIAFSTVGATLAARIQDALEDLSNVGAGGVIVSSAGTNLVTVEFTGKNSADDLGEMAPVTINSAAGLVAAATLTQGKAGGEAMFSATRGWPACGVFYSQRLWLGGMASRPQTVLASRLGDYFNLDIKGATSASGVSLDIDTDEATPILDFFPGQHLQIFTGLAEFHLATLSPPSIPRNTKKGLQPGTSPVELDTTTMFVQAGGNAVLSFAYDDSIAKYRSNNLAKLASHRVRGVVDLAVRRAFSTYEPDRALMVRDDGQLAVMSALLEDDVVGFTGWTTDGRFLAAVSDIAGETHLAVARPLAAGGEEILLEALDEAAVLDCEVYADDLDQVVGGLGHFAGREVVAYIDGADAGDVLVEGTEALLPYPPLRDVRLGSLFVPRFVSLPVVLEEDRRSGAGRRNRVGEIGLRLGPTANIQAGMADSRMWDVPLKRRPTAVLDEGPGENAFSGWTRLQGVPGFNADGQVEIRQPRPGPLEIQEIVVTVES